jgi:Bacterial protein of unknown function (DUF922)
VPRATSLLSIFVLGCASAPAPVPPGRAAPKPRAVLATPRLEDLVRGDLADDHALAWSPQRLTWSDFQGAPPAEGSEGAKTSYALYSAWRCRGTRFEFRVIAGFRPRQSWVKAVVLQDTAQRGAVLSHEQTHFDLAEVHARMMRGTFGALTSPCRKTDQELSALAERLVQAEKAEQRRYDAETNHGLRAAEQAAWNASVARRLR